MKTATELMTLLQRPVLRRGIVVILWLTILVSAVDFFVKTHGLKPPIMTDFDSFAMVGRLALSSDPGLAYDFRALLGLQAAAGYIHSAQPFTYPPPALLLMAVLGSGPVWLCYAVFMALSLGLWLWGLRALPVLERTVLLLFLFPALIIALRTGQTGLLIAGLAAQLWLTQHRGWAALWLGMTIIKPHLALGPGLMALVMRRWRVLIGAATVGVALALLAALIWGHAIYTAFLTSLKQAQIFLAADFYQLHRMVSAYAFAASLGLPALPIHGLVMLGYGVLLWRSPTELRLPLALLAPFFLSPYVYDYDLPLAGLALAMILPQLLTRARGGQLLWLGLWCWLAGGWGLLGTTIIETLTDAAPGEPPGMTFISLGFVFFLAAVVQIGRIWRQA